MAADGSLGTGPAASAEVRREPKPNRPLPPTRTTEIRRAGPAAMEMTAAGAAPEAGARA